MNIKPAIQLVMIDLKVRDDSVLFILLNADGTVNRMGTGAVDNDKKGLYMGRTADPLFASLMATLDERLLARPGRWIYKLPDPQGPICTLSVIFQTQGEGGKPSSEIGLEFVYGDESQGPPNELVDFVKEAARLTDPWLAAQEQMSQGPQ